MNKNKQQQKSSTKVWLQSSGNKDPVTDWCMEWKAKEIYTYLGITDQTCNLFGELRSWMWTKPKTKIRRGMPRRENTGYLGDQTVSIIRVWMHSAGQCFLGWLCKDHLKELCKNTDLSAKSLGTDYPRQFFRTFVIRATATGNPDMSRLDIQATFVAGKITFWKREKLVKVYWSSLKNIKLEIDLRHISEAELLESGDQQKYFGVIKKIEELRTIPRFTPLESLVLHQVLT